MQINTYNSLHKWTQGQKSHGHLNKCRKGFKNIMSLRNKSSEETKDEENMGSRGSPEYVKA